MFDKERELVEIGLHSYNLKEGGDGGWDYLNKSGVAEEGRDKGRRSLKMKNSLKRRHLEGKYKSFYFGSDPDKSSKAVVTAQSETAKKKRLTTMRLNGHQQGEKNSQYGTMWITDGILNRKIKKEDVIPEGWRKGMVAKIILPH